MRSETRRAIRAAFLTLLLLYIYNYYYIPTSNFDGSNFEDGPIPYSILDPGWGSGLITLGW